MKAKMEATTLTLGFSATSGLPAKSSGGEQIATDI
jgi:hypothetical protein